ncbi:hybrid sensor histidine kinase/response regulator transcription factor [Paucihalobacter ruber]|uniref:hybrid sensor histidine kinase/response regulator transcription factor n=1 Tax=Paucihalobacter ruber TaxID=2567861 RepID=UPI001C1EADED|nr:two-component regulator propeller domain-containing protein [Paucihalobacter ruber]
MIVQLFVYKVGAQSQITFRQLSVKEGLSQNSVISIAQDSTGYLWLATQDGLNKYDGQSFKKYEFLFTDITNVDYSDLGKIYLDKEDNLWIIPSSNIPHKYNVQRDTFLPIPELKDVSCIFQDLQLNLWFGTYQNGLFKLNHDSGEIEQILAPEITSKIYAITEDNNGKLWIGCKGKMISYNLISRKITNYKPDLIEEIHFGSIVINSNNDIFAGTFGDGLWVKGVNDEQFKYFNDDRFKDLDKLKNIYVLSLFMDSKNNLWVGTYGSGLFKVNFDESLIRQFTVKKNNPKTIHYNDILSIYEDFSGVLWFGTDGAGVSYYDEYLDKFNYYTNFLAPEDINIDVVRSVVTDSDGVIWVGTSGKGLTKFNPNDESWKTFLESNESFGLACDRIMSLHVDKQNNLWVGTQDGGLHLKDKNERFIQYKNHPTARVDANTIWRIHEDYNDHIWLATGQQGLIQFDKNKGVVNSFSKDQKNFPSNNIRVVINAEPGFLWVATEERHILKLNTATGSYEDFSRILFQNQSQIQYNYAIKTLLYQNDQVLWIGSAGNGIMAIDLISQKLYNYSIEDGLANNVIYAIMPDEKRRFWLSSNKGISLFLPPKTWDEQPGITNYTSYDGLSIEFNTGAYHTSKNGDIYFGALDGFYWLNPKDIKNNSEPPKTVISKLEVNNTEMDVSEKLKLKSFQNTLTLTFSSLQFSLPHKNYFRYQLEGYDENWSQASNINFARYTNLPAGDYSFKVLSSNYDGVWSQSPAQFSFKILKPWYSSTGAIVIYTLLTLLASYLIYTYFKVRWQMQLELKVEHDKAERLKQLNDYKTKLYANLSHEFRTPLTLISAPVKKQLQSNDLSSEAREDLILVDRNANKLSGLVNQLLELSKLESGFIKLKVSYSNIELFLHAIVSSFVPLAVQKPLKLSNNIEVTQFAWYDTDVLEKIINNLLSNAVKYTPKGGEIIFNALIQEGHLMLSVQNTITEIKEQELEKIFDRFYQIDSNNEGFGIGLSLIKELVALNKGTIKAEYLNDKTIQFLINIPVEKTLFNQSDLQEPTAQELKHILTQEEESSQQLSEKEIILVVEDNTDMLQFLTRLFEPKYNVIQAQDGLDGINKAFQYIPDVIISDIMMPKTDGITLCNTLKEDEKTSHVPIILLTAKSGEENELIGLKTGADDYILKPFNPEKIQIRVQKLIEIRNNLRMRYQQAISLEPKDIAITATDEKFLNKLQQILDEHLVNPEFSAESFSKEIGMSRMQLHRKLVALTGLSTTAFIKSQRLKYAVNLLQNSNANVAEVAYSSGFNSPSYFAKSFKDTYGKSPLEYFNGD